MPPEPSKRIERTAGWWSDGADVHEAMVDVDMVCSSSKAVRIMIDEPGFLDSLESMYNGPHVLRQRAFWSRNLASFFC